MPPPTLRIIFMGTADIACPSLEALLGQPDWQVLAVVSQPDKPKGRHLKLQPTPVKQIALAHNLPVLQPARARNAAFVEQLTALTPDLIAVMAYGQIVPQSILDLPRFGCVNVHTSILPKYRGAAPIQWAILNDEPETGVTIMKMDAGLDSGDILSIQTTPIHPEDNAQTLHDRLAQMGAELLVKTIRGYVSGEIKPRPQPAECECYARKIKKEDGRLDWTQPARALWNRVRAFTPWPGAFTFLNVGADKSTLLKVWQAETVETSTGEPGKILSADKTGILVACGKGALRILELQAEDRRKMAVQEFLAGHPLHGDAHFES